MQVNSSHLRPGYLLLIQDNQMNSTVLERQKMRKLSSKQTFMRKNFPDDNLLPAHKFKSQFTIYELILMLLGIWIHWIFYEVGEGKNLSDMLGSLYKLAYIRRVSWWRPLKSNIISPGWRLPSW